MIMYRLFLSISIRLNIKIYIFEKKNKVIQKFLIRVSIICFISIHDTSQFYRQVTTFIKTASMLTFDMETLSIPDQ